MKESTLPAMPLPARARLLHVGPPKTGTTALQTALAAKRRELLAHGVRYPGTGVDHGMAVAAFLGQRWGWGGQGSGVPSAARWSALLAEVRAERARRVVLGHEYAAKSDAATIARFRDALGPDLHVAITLRDPASMLPSIWQESLKLGATRGFDAFLRRNLLDRGPDGRDHPARNQGALVERWAAGIGADRVVVIALDRTRPDLLFGAFESLLGLPAGLLDRDAGGTNRGLSRAEAELLRGVNRAAKRVGMRWDDYSVLVERAAIGALLAEPPPAEDPRVVLPPWAHDALREQAEGWTAAVRASGVRVVGDLDALVPGPTPPEPARDDGRITRSTAVAALAGVVEASAARGRDAPASGLTAVDPREYLVVKNVGIGGLLRVVASRALRRGGTAARIPFARLRR